MKKTLIIGFILIFCFGSICAQKQSHQLFLDAIAEGDLKTMSAGCQVGQSVTEISLNNTRAFLHTDGVLWYNSGKRKGGYEVPKGSEKPAIYTGGLWIGGTDISGQLKVSAAKYKPGRNYWPGPLKVQGEEAGTTDYESCYQYDKHYKVSRQEVETFREWHNSTNEDRSINIRGYSIPQIILDWPAHGDVAAGFDNYLAPFWDNNNDGLYNPVDGDYPFFDLDGILPCGTSREQKRTSLYGDGTAWWVYNDNGHIHSSPNGEGIGLEIRAQAFQFSANDALNDMSFYNFEMINRSTYTLFDSYVGFFIDGDIGYGSDDYVGCHVSKGIGYFYNSQEIDGSGQEYAYGTNPPALGIDFFEGPYKDPNGLDDCSSYDENNNLICNECILNGNINGLNYGDGIVDNERLGMSKFIHDIYRGMTGPMFYYADYYRFTR